jgi:hypothetical protein
MKISLTAVDADDTEKILHTGTASNFPNIPLCDLSFHSSLHVLLFKNLNYSAASPRSAYF